MVKNSIVGGLYAYFSGCYKDYDGFEFCFFLQTLTPRRIETINNTQSPIVELQHLLSFVEQRTTGDTTNQQHTFYSNSAVSQASSERSSSRSSASIRYRPAMETITNTPGLWTIGGVAAITAIAGAGVYHCQQSKAGKGEQTSRDTTNPANASPNAAGPSELSQRIVEFQQEVEALRASVESADISLSEAGTTMANLIWEMRKCAGPQPYQIGKKERAKLVGLSSQAIQSVALALQVESVQFAPNLDKLEWSVPPSRGGAWWKEGVEEVGRLAGLMDLLHLYAGHGEETLVPGIVHRLFASLESDFETADGKSFKSFRPLLHSGRATSKPLFECLAYALLVLARSQSVVFHAGSRAVPSPKLFGQVVASPEHKTIGGGPTHAASIHRLDRGVVKDDIATYKLEDLPGYIKDAILQPPEDTKFKVVRVE